MAYNIGVTNFRCTSFFIWHGMTSPWELWTCVRKSSLMDVHECHWKMKIFKHTFKKCPTTSMREIHQCNIDEFSVPLNCQVLQDVNLELHMELNSLGIYFTNSPQWCPLGAWSSYRLKSMVLGLTVQNFAAPSNLAFFFLLRKKCT